MNGTPLLLAIIGHLVGDYLLQNDWMAMNKKRASWPCVVHCVLWTAAVALFSGWLWIPGIKSLVVGLVLFSTHFIQDRTFLINRWMMIGWKDQRQFMQCDQIVKNRITGEPEIKAGLGPWSIIVVDNVWHIVTLWAVWRFIA